MAVIDDLISQISDESLRQRIAEEVKGLKKQKKFGLVFEEHVPECTPLYEMPIKVGKKVALKEKSIKDIYTVLSIEEDNVKCFDKVNKEEKLFKLNDLVCVAEFGEPIYPYLKPIDSICNAPDSDLWHTLIEADNYHALQLLEYLYAGKVDCIYIDPPYNTGAKDWKYNNDYVDSVDEYRHSKWLSMMEKRLKLAKDLLNPKDSMLIVTIDEKEYLHLGCLLEEIFEGSNIQMVSSVINPHGANRKNMFARVEEYIYFVFVGEASVHQGQNDMLNPVEKNERDTWARLLRGGASGLRVSSPNQFYPVFCRYDDGKYFGVGDVVPLGQSKDEVEIPEGCFALWPIGQDGKERCWGLTIPSFVDKVGKGYIKFGPYKQGSNYRALYHLQSGTISAIENGDMEVLGKTDEGTLIVGSLEKPKRPVSMWVQPLHDSRVHGAMLLNKFFPDIRFQFPKSLYAVVDTIRFAVADKPNALILDFFAGSGTTLHAVNILNREDNGHRRCILVTNNELSEREAQKLTKAGFKRGDSEWDELGIARYVTWPRTKCSILGIDVTGNSIKGEYANSDYSMSDGFKSNANFFKLSFLDKNNVRLGRNFKELLPVLWMKSGSVGECPIIDDDNIDMLILPKNKMAVLLNEDSYAKFISRINKEDIRTIFFVTDFEPNFISMASNFKECDCYQLYRDYLDNFRINVRRS